MSRRRLTHAEWDRLHTPMLRGDWREMLTIHSMDNLTPVCGHPIWWYMLEWFPQHIGEIYSLTRFDVNAAIDNAYGGNVLWMSERDSKSWCALPTLLAIGLNANHRDTHGRSCIDIYIERGHVLGPRENRGLCLLAEHGCTMRETTKGPCATDMRAHVSRSRARHAAARLAAASLISVCMRMGAGRDIACLLGQALWQTRRQRTKWSPVEECEIELF